MTVIDKYIADRLGWEWGETGISSDAMLRQALGGRPVAEWEYPRDWDDLARCRTTYRTAPWALRRRMRATLRDFRSHVREQEQGRLERDSFNLAEDARVTELMRDFRGHDYGPGIRLVDDEPMYSSEWLDDPQTNLWEPPIRREGRPADPVRHDDDCKCGKCIGQPRYGPPLDREEE